MFDLAVTDSEWDQRFRGKPIGAYDSTDLGVKVGTPTFLTLGLGEPFHGDCYKLVAAVMLVPGS